MLSGKNPRTLFRIILPSYRGFSGERFFSLSLKTEPELCGGSHAEKAKPQQISVFYAVFRYFSHVSVFPGTFLNISSLFFAAGPASPARLPVSPASLKAVPAADLTAENSQDEICIPVTNALNFVFTFLSQSQTPKLSCKLISVKKLNDDAMKKWQEKDRAIIKKCIFDTIYTGRICSPSLVMTLITR